MKWSRLFEGYNLVEESNENREALIFAKKYLDEHLSDKSIASKNFEFESILVRDLPKIGKNYKIILNKPAKESIVLYCPTNG